MQTWQRETRERRLPDLSVSLRGRLNWLWSAMVASQKENLFAK